MQNNWITMWEKYYWINDVRDNGQVQIVPSAINESLRSHDNLAILKKY